MAESSTEKKEDNLEESSSSEEWTIIDQKESKIDNTSDEESGSKHSSLDQETVIAEDACETEENKPEVEHVEEGEEAGEKDIESDDVSILSDESESEQLITEEGRIQKIEWQVERHCNESKALIPKMSSDGNSSPYALISSTYLICSLIVVTLAIVIAGRVAVLQGDVTYAANVDIAEKLKELAAIEDKLKELSDVKQALDQIRISMPEMKKLKDQLINQKYERNKFKYSLEDYKNFENLNKQNIFNSNIQNDRLEMLEATYTNFCSIMNKVNSTNPNVENNLCRTPKVLSDMITFRKNLKRAFKSTQKDAMAEKRMFVDAGRKLDVISESLLSEFSTMFARFSFKMQERLNKFGYKLHQRLCLLNDFEKSDDKFLNILLDDDFFINNCNETTDPITADYKSNTSHSKKVKYRESKKNSVDEPKKDEKNYYKNNKTYKKFKDAEEDYTNTDKGESFDVNVNMKSKGEIKYDSWKKNNHEKERYYYVENKLSKNEKFEENSKNDYKQKEESKSEFDKSFEKIDVNQEYSYKADDKNNKRNYKSDRKYDYKKDRQYDDNREFEHKRDHDVDFKLHQNKQYHSFEQKIESKKDNDYANQFESKRNGEVEKKIEKKRNGRPDDTNDNSKFIIKMDHSMEDKLKNNNEERQNYKSKEYVLRPENFKESKYAKYEKHERRGRKDKYPTGEWQMQRGKAREKQRNSDWYFVRADSRQKARTNNEDEAKEEETVWRRSPPPNKKNRSDKFQSCADKEDSFRRRVMRKVGRTWDFLNKEIRNFF